MAELPRSLPEFEARFPDEAACARWLLEKRWPDGFRCPACGHGEAWELGRERLTLQCTARERQGSVTAGTVLHGSHLSLRTWFLAAWLMATHANGISALTTHQLLRVGARSGIAAGSVGAERGDVAWWEGSRRSLRRSAGTWAHVCPGSTRRGGKAWPC